MVEAESKTCTCAEPELRVYTTRHTTEHKIQYLSCKLCNKPAGHKRILSILAQRVAALESQVSELIKSARA